jgi:hypothetical protein
MEEWVSARDDWFRTAEWDGRAREAFEAGLSSLPNLPHRDRPFGAVEVRVERSGGWRAVRRVGGE